ncbi:YfiT family bacillithiol transferase [Chengkuizengella axinellae]|uniref:Putative metal-dependent hydrolase Q5Y73_07150 n=1 Tax=Chengkuizengella axinellae TaxID=3064388 RepID=A0ABT9IWY9_9BACL|nr:putative metal-dependent hydrolase [Chengkuizengella sp. 2205SS18-9]MDP5273876.1 putative metal-dependent hydrolase [Chengkuizengella sp. 2205SS18-9]
MEALRYPIGKFEHQGEITEDQINLWIQQMDEAPKILRAAVEGLNEEQLNTPYRPEGWTIRQVVHHLSDSHMNGFIRFKWTLTEDTPTIKAYNQKGWAQLSDSFEDIQVSLTLFESLHNKWVSLLKSLSPNNFESTFIHPELGSVSLKTALGIYAWHGEHHTAHITSLKSRMGWE